MTVRSSLNQALRRGASAAFLVLAACAPRTQVALAPLPDRPWTVLPGDEVRVRVYREPELNGQWVVNGQGEVLLPGLGRMVVAGLTVDSLTALISSSYATRIIDAVVDVGIVRMIPVLGEVRGPGVYAAEPTMTVQQLVAKSGGIRGTSLRSPTVMLQKGRDGTRYALAIDQRLDRLPIDDGDAILVFDPSFLERWAPWVMSFNQFGALITTVLAIIVATKR